MQKMITCCQMRQRVKRHMCLSFGLGLWHQSKQIFLPHSKEQKTCPGCQANPFMSNFLSLAARLPPYLLCLTHFASLLPFCLTRLPLPSQVDTISPSFNPNRVLLGSCFAFSFVTVFVFSSLLDFSPVCFTFGAYIL